MTLDPELKYTKPKLHVHLDTEIEVFKQDFPSKPPILSDVSATVDA